MSDYILVESDDYEETSKEYPIVYIDNIKNGLAILIHRYDSSILMNLKVVEGQLKVNELEFLLSEIHSEIDRVDIFKSLLSNSNDVKMILCMLTRYNIPSSLYNMYVDEFGKVSIGYNCFKNCYYQIRMNQDIPMFEEIKLKKALK